MSAHRHRTTTDVSIRLHKHGATDYQNRPKEAWRKIEYDWEFSAGSCAALTYARHAADGRRTAPTMKELPLLQYHDEIHDSVLGNEVKRLREARDTKNEVSDGQNTQHFGCLERSNAKRDPVRGSSSKRREEEPTDIP